MTPEQGFATATEPSSENIDEMEAQFDQPDQATKAPASMFDDGGDYPRVQDAPVWPPE